MMMTCEGEIQRPSGSGEKVAFDDSIDSNSEPCATGLTTVLPDVSSVPSSEVLRVQSQDSQRPRAMDAQELKMKECMRTFFAEAMARSGQKLNHNGDGDRMARFVEETELQPSVVTVVSPPDTAASSAAATPEGNTVNDSSCATTTSGLDLLGSLALTKPPAESSSSPAAKMAPLDKTVKEWVEQETAAKMKKEARMYVEKVLEWDVLCGRGGKSNHWSGNKRYRQVVSEMKNMYRSQDDKSAKTDLSRAIVDYVCNYGGRFLKKEGYSDRYYVLTRAEARKKTSQALRETKEPKWTL